MDIEFREFVTVFRYLDSKGTSAPSLLVRGGT